jgi:hypothetical protein
MPKLFASHAAERAGNATTNYLAVVGGETLWHPTTPVRPGQVTDPLAMTILIAENLGAGVHRMEPRDLSFADLDPRLNSPAGVSSPYADPAVAMGDGSVVRLRGGLHPDALRGMLTVRGGERLSLRDDGHREVIPDGRFRPLRSP